jgi:uncharacterized membrane protein HdeD (DUF308 family)
VVVGVSLSHEIGQCAVLRQGALEVVAAFVIAVQPVMGAAEQPVRISQGMAIGPTTRSG